MEVSRLSAVRSVQLIPHVMKKRSSRVLYSAHETQIISKAGGCSTSRCGAKMGYHPSKRRKQNEAKNIMSNNFDSTY